MIFSRGKRTVGRHARSRQEPASGEASGTPDASPDPTGPPGAGSPVPSPTTGPYDITEAPAGVRRLDLGSLRVPSVTGVQVRVQASPDGTIQRVVLIHGRSALQVAAYAAPRTEPIWDEVRAEIRTSLFAEGVTAREEDGEYGVELRARVRTKDGPRDVRVVGVDGPRWLVRAEFQGPAAADPGSAPQLIECLHGLVVDRGTEAMPAKEQLPLRLSPEMAAQVQEQATVAVRAGQPAPPARPARDGRAGGRKPSPHPVTDGPNGAGPAPGGG